MSNFLILFFYNIVPMLKVSNNQGPTYGYFLRKVAKFFS
ncbi:hypothetical protein QE357_004654 [Siphonobacter sp. BAB-5404]|nr:hypothetical protein [Siphonobacter sp. SORGH_AS_0500]